MLFILGASNPSWQHTVSNNQDKVSDLPSATFDVNHKLYDHVASIQFLRFVAATLVVGFHTTQAASKYFPGSVSSAALHVAGIGEAGVHIFFVISGFIMVYTSFFPGRQTYSARIFLLRRFIRIYPVYIVYALTYLLYYEFAGQGKDLTWTQVVGSLLLLPGYSSAIIGPGWTLSYEVYFYICFGVAMMLGLKSGLWALTTVFLVSIGLRTILDTREPAVHLVTNALLLEFLLGAWIGYVALHGFKIKTKIADLLLAAGLLGFAAGIVLNYSKVPATAAWAFPAALVIAGLVFRELNGSMPDRVKRYAFLGDSSYSLYLLHILLIDAVLLLVHSIFGPIRIQSLFMDTWAIFVFGLLVVSTCIASAIVAYQLVERRLVTSLQRFLIPRERGLPSVAKTAWKN